MGATECALLSAAALIWYFFHLLLLSVCVHHIIYFQYSLFCVKVVHTQQPFGWNAHLCLRRRKRIEFVWFSICNELIFSTCWPSISAAVCISDQSTLPQSFNHLCKRPWIYVEVLFWTWSKHTISMTRPIRISIHVVTALEHEVSKSKNYPAHALIADGGAVAI